MVRCGALYLVIVVALIVGVICATLLISFLIFRLQYAKAQQSGRLEINANSGISILRADSDAIDPDFKLLDLYHDGRDSIAIKKMRWGLYSIGLVKSFHHRDTVAKVFSMCNALDSANSPVIYLKDENHPLYVTKTTKLAGRIQIPGGALQLIDLDETTYEKETASKVSIKPSKKHLPKLRDTTLLTHLGQFNFSNKKIVDDTLQRDTVNNSFLSNTLFIRITKRNRVLRKKSFTGNIILIADSTITVDSTSRLTNVILFAPQITIKSGFRGNCQLFSTNTVSIESHCSLTYPSVIALLNIKDLKNDHHQVLIGDSTSFSGAILSQATAYQSIPIYMSIGNACRLTGSIYCDGLLRFNGACKIVGSVFTQRLLTGASSGTYENILIDLDFKPLYRYQYYLIPAIFPSSLEPQQIMQWFERE